MTFHTGKLQFLCNLCEDSFKSKVSLDRHLKLHQDGAFGPFHCPYEGCNEVYETKNLLKDHERLVHRIICPECGIKVARYDYMPQHMKTHQLERDQVYCEWPGCTKVFYSTKSLKLHIRINHEDDKRFECPDCGERFGYKSILKRHYNLIHKKELLADGSFVVQEIPERPIKKLKLNSEAAILSGFQYEEERPLCCMAPGCDLRFKRQADLRRHVLDEHNNDLSLDLNFNAQDIKFYDNDLF